jgi:hypothetical protein
MHYYIRKSLHKYSPLTAFTQLTAKTSTILISVARLGKDESKNLEYIHDVLI